MRPEASPAEHDADLAPLCEACGSSTNRWALARTCDLLRCSRCGHIKRSLKRCGAGARTAAWGGRERDALRIGSVTQRLRWLLRHRAGRLSILEIGFGRGDLLARFHRLGHDVVGVDSGMMDSEPRTDLPSSVTVYREKAETMELPPLAFDLVVGIHVVEHLDDPAAVFDRCYRSLRPGGMLYLLTPNGSSAGLAVFRDRWWHLEDPTHVRFFTSASARRMLSDAGFGSVWTSRPGWDSLTVEVSSLLRVFFRSPREHGVMGIRGALPIYAALTPIALCARLLWPSIIPNLEIVARKVPASGDLMDRPSSSLG